MSEYWQTGISQEMLELRAGLLQRIRAFMKARGVLEVDTPILGHAAVTDPNLLSFTTCFRHPAGSTSRTLFLSTSPEFAMKRMLACGSGPIYQITHAFRDAEAGRLHNPEFTMFEWYRTGYDEHALMDELGDLLLELDFRMTQKKKYGDVFQQAIGLDPHRADEEMLQQAARDHGLAGALSDRAGLLDFLFNRCVAEKLGHEQPVFIHDYPACQCALARLSEDDPPVARRFELFINGIEIANGFYELADAEEQRRRFERDHLRRREVGLPETPTDERLLQALEHGLPDCAGVAVGIDRLLMVRQGCDELRQVLPFPIDHA
ncbi:MAG: EF-P lysine aminoacylase EpmA [Gammaproteobacteria bacterium]